eukprot:CAMPEP_0167772540 /NCGR_PEP_ID=MMETSP0111_2-20121227/904_1 /TAXON_ID=91324 /ORGANISM="Lotharella globosa, Strain CCCM811" /LENGTH=292 /DNA_ID=CAMNT_0007662043 /DNA_START=193 /DNA_END=1071 /DNA_ORIENTATION=-
MGSIAAAYAGFEEDDSAFATRDPFSGATEVEDTAALADIPEGVPVVDSLDTKPQSRPIPKSPVQWARFRDDRRQSYYFNAHTGETQWEKPNQPYVVGNCVRHRSLDSVGSEGTKVCSQPSSQQHITGVETQDDFFDRMKDVKWIRHIDQKTGIAYYQNLETNETQWDKPKEAVAHNVEDFEKYVRSREQSTTSLPSMDHVHSRKQSIVRANPPPLHTREAIQMASPRIDSPQQAEREPSPDAQAELDRTLSRLIRETEIPGHKRAGSNIRYQEHNAHHSGPDNTTSLSSIVE